MYQYNDIGEVLTSPGSIFPSFLSTDTQMELQLKTQVLLCWLYGHMLNCF